MLFIIPALSQHSPAYSVMNRCDLRISGHRFSICASHKKGEVSSCWSPAGQYRGVVQAIDLASFKFSHHETINGCIASFKELPYLNSDQQLYIVNIMPAQLNNNNERQTGSVFKTNLPEGKH